MLLWNVAFAEWTENDAVVEFVCIIFAYVYFGLSPAVHEQSTILSMPYWLIQLWGEAYFPNIDAAINDRKAQVLTARPLSKSTLHTLLTKIWFGLSVGITRRMVSIQPSRIARVKHVIVKPLQPPKHLRGFISLAFDLDYL